MIQDEAYIKDLIEKIFQNRVSINDLSETQIKELHFQKDKMRSDAINQIEFFCGATVTFHDGRKIIPDFDYWASRNVDYERSFRLENWLNQNKETGKPGPKTPQIKELKDILQKKHKEIDAAIKTYLNDGPVDVYKLPAIVSELIDRKHLKKNLKFGSVVKFLYSYYGIQATLTKEATYPRGAKGFRKQKFAETLDDTLVKMSIK